jgi:predicted MFS family arabinose efflux permease
LSRSVWGYRGMPDLGVVAVTGFSGYAVLLTTAPLWAVHGGASEAGAGLVNGVLLSATVLAQLLVPRALRRWGTGPVLCVGLLLLGAPAPAYLLDEGLALNLLISGVRGAGFGILTVTGSAATAHLVPPARRGAAIGAFGLCVAIPNLALLPASVPLVERWGFTPVFLTAALPVLGVPAALRLGRALLEGGHDRPDPDEATPGRRALLAIVAPTLVLFAVTMAGGAIISFAPQFTSPGTAALALLLLGATSALSRWLIGSVADRLGARQFLAPLLGLAAVATAACAWAIHAEHAVALVAAATTLGLSYGALQNLTLVVAFASVAAHQVPAASAGWNIGFDAGTAVGSVVAGVIAATYGFPVALAVMAAGCAVAVCAVGFTRADSRGRAI